MKDAVEAAGNTLQAVLVLERHILEQELPHPVRYSSAFICVMKSRRDDPDHLGILQAVGEPDMWCTGIIVKRIASLKG